MARTGEGHHIPKIRTPAFGLGGSEAAAAQGVAGAGWVPCLSSSTQGGRLPALACLQMAVQVHVCFVDRRSVMYFFRPPTVAFALKYFHKQFLSLIPLWTRHI